MKFLRILNVSTSHSDNSLLLRAHMNSQFEKSILEEKIHKGMNKGH